MKKLNKGQSLFEVILAIFIVALILVAIVTLSTSSISNSTSSKNKTLASKYSQEAIEWLRLEKEDDMSNFKEKILANTTYCLSDLTTAWTNVGVCSSDEKISDTIFTREVVFEDADLSGKMIVTASITTSWTDSRGLHEARVVTYFTDSREQ